MDRWQVTIQCWPHSSGKGASVDQELAGPREQTYYVNAEDIEGALKMAKCISQGMCANPATWRAPIFGIVRVAP